MNETRKIDRAFALNKWVPALRSGHYQQGHGRLGTRRAGDEPRLCCLGVAATLRWPEEVKWGSEGENKWGENKSGENGVCCLGVAAVLLDPDEAEWAGRIEWGSEDEIKIEWESLALGTSICSIDRSRWDLPFDPDAVIVMNDDEEATFEDIADYIEEKLA